MARLARADLVDPTEVAVFHCINRCVRQCYLCGDDSCTQRNYDHRKQWLEERLVLLAGLFGIDMIGFAVLSNHFHVVLRSRPDVVANWDDTEVARRWLLLCPQRRQESGLAEEPNEAELATIRNNPVRLAEIRLRLSNISWLMKMAAESIARRANREDEATGRFWQGRFTCAKLCDEAALLACLVYVDLNPIRAGLALSPEQSNYTSVQRRIESLLGQSDNDAWLAPIEIDPAELGPLPSQTNRRASDKGVLSMTTVDYLALVDWTGRQLRPDKQGSIPSQLAPLLERLGIVEPHWLLLVQNFGRYFGRIAGAPRSVAQVRPKQHTHRTFRKGRAELLGAA